MAPKLLVEVAPGRPASGDTPEVGPTYTVATSPDGIHRPAGINTCYDLFRASAEKFADQDCLGSRVAGPDGKPGPYKFITYKEAFELAAKVGSAFLHLGLKPKDRLGVFGPNSIEWMISMQGCNRTSLQCVPLYDTLGEKAIEYVMTHSETKFVVADGSKLAGLAKSLKGFQGQLLGVAYWGAAPEEAKQAVTAAGVQLLSWEQLLQLGADNPRDAVPPSPEDLCTIMYTSGTTGNPKGVMHTHGSVMSEVECMREFLDGQNMKVQPRDIYFSFLTLAHIFDRVVEEMVLFLGAAVGYYSGDTRKVLDDAKELRPTVFAGVPRVYERVYSGVLDKVEKAGGIKAAMFHAAYAYKQFWMKLGFNSEWASPVANRVVFKNTQAAVGGRLRVFLSGGAPLPKYAQDFMQVAMCVPVLQGYGLTETCAATFVQYPNKQSHVGTVGPPMPGVQMRLEAVHELGHRPTANPPRGEVCVRGPMMFQGYYKQPELTAQEVDGDGFFHTGDIGELTPEGTLKIIDRKKNIFKLSQGEYVAVEFLEAEFGKCELVEQIWLYGSSFEATLVAVVVPVKDKLMAWAAGQAELKGKGFKEVCSSSQAKEHMLASLTATGKEARLKGFEFPKAVHVEPEPFSIEQDLVTPKLSLKRPQLKKHYKAQIDAMYAGLKAAGALPKSAPAASSAAAPSGDAAPARA
ncbi:acetyl-CoA synthetase-like protein [Scenedesmus sp. NREL 46B-D3]|nr:acetyl-CoA synthetase-like protein [Scenedesmus sp. NREL 46B-D3]